MDQRGDDGQGGWAGHPESERVVVKLRGPDDVVGVLPWRLGFHPAESLVLLVLQGRRRRERLVMRLDLPDPGDEVVVAEQTAARAVRAGADEVLVVVYTGQPDRGGLPRAELVDDLVALLEEQGVTVPEAVLVRGGRRWSYRCADRGCCPPEGVPLPDRPTPAADRYAAEAVARGTAVLPDREAVRRGITPSEHPVAVAAREQAREQVRRGPDVLGAAGPDRSPAPTARLARLRERFARGEREPPSALDALVVALGLRDRHARDALMTAALDDDAAEVRDLLRHVARLVDDEVAAPVCTVLGWLAYAAGDGAQALVAVERALQADPGCTMARLLLDGIDGMVPPAALREVSRAVRAELGEGGAA